MDEKGRTNLYFVSPDGHDQEDHRGLHVLAGLSLAKNGQAAAVLSTSTGPALVTFTLPSPRDQRRSSTSTPTSWTASSSGRCEELRFKSPDGWDIQGWLIKPAEFDPAKKYPLRPLDPRRSLVDVLRRLQLGLAELRRQRLCRPLHESAGQHRLRPGLRQRHPVFLSGEGLRRPDGRRRRRPRQGVHRQGQPLRLRRQRRRRAHGLDRRPHQPVPGRRLDAAGHQLALVRRDTDGAHAGTGSSRNIPGRTRWSTRSARRSTMSPTSRRRPWS